MQHRNTSRILQGQPNNAVADGLARAASRATKSDEGLRNLIESSRTRVAAESRTRENVDRFHNGQLPALNKIGKDGVQHINVSGHATTDLGIALAMTTNLPFDHDHVGRVTCMEGFWQWLGSDPKSKALLKAEYYSVRNLQSQLTFNWAELKHQRILVLDAMWQKIQHYAEIKDVLRESVLPFDYYTRQKETQILKRPGFASWLTMGLEVIRKALKADAEPNFFQFIDDKVFAETPKLSELEQLVMVGDIVKDFYTELKIQRVDAEQKPKQEKRPPKQPQQPKPAKAKKPKQSTTEVNLINNVKAIQLEAQPAVTSTDANLSVTLMDVFTTDKGFTSTIIDRRTKNDPRGHFVPVFLDLPQEVREQQLASVAPDVLDGLVVMKVRRKGKDVYFLVSKNEKLAWDGDEEAGKLATGMVSQNLTKEVHAAMPRVAAGEVRAVEGGVEVDVTVEGATAEQVEALSNIPEEAIMVDVLPCYMQVDGAFGWVDQTVDVRRNNDPRGPYIPEPLALSDLDLDLLRRYLPEEEVQGMCVVIMQGENEETHRLYVKKPDVNAILERNLPTQEPVGVTDAA